MHILSILLKWKTDERKCVFKYSLNSMDGEGQVFLDEKWMLKLYIFETNEIGTFVPKIQV